VLDPLGDHPVVMTGSHNMGIKAATKNDDNLVIVEGDRDLAVAYALNVISAFNHYWWRYNQAPPEKRQAAAQASAAGTHPSVPPPKPKRGAPVAAPAAAAPKTTKAWTGLQTTDAWQDKFYSADASERSEAEFWGARAT